MFQSPPNAKRQNVICNAVTDDLKNTDVLIQKYMHIFGYYHDNNRKVAALNLWVNGHRIFHGATIVKNFDTYKNIPSAKNSPPDIKTLWPFVEDNIIDHTRIITCFENFMKGFLLLNKCVVHKLSNKNKTLKNVQVDRPIKMDEIFSEASFKNFAQDKPEQWETTSNTVNFSWLLKPEYQKIINLPADIISVIKDINEERNNLHFISVESFQFGKPTIEKYAKIIDFVEKIIKPSIYGLKQDIDLIEKNMQDKRHSI